MAYTAGGISAMGRRPRDDNPFNPDEDPAAHERWDAGWVAHRSVSRDEAGRWWWRVTWSYVDKFFGYTGRFNQ